MPPSQSLPGLSPALCERGQSAQSDPTLPGQQEALDPQLQLLYLQLLVVEFPGGVVQGGAIRVFSHEPFAVAGLLTDNARLFTFAFQ